MLEIFICHAFKYSEPYCRIVRWLDEAQAEGMLVWKNASLPEYSPVLYLFSSARRGLVEAKLESQIASSAAVIVDACAYSPSKRGGWIDFELSCAGRLHKAVIALRKPRSTCMPEAIQICASAVAEPNRDALVQAILSCCSAAKT